MSVGGNEPSDDNDLNPNDDISLISEEIDTLFDPFAGYTIEERILLAEISQRLYGRYLMEMVQEACNIDFCNNPYNTLGDYPMSVLSPDQAQLITSTYSNQFTNKPTQLLLQVLDADDFSTNPWNFEPNWVSALQQLNSNALREAKRLYISIQNNNSFIEDLYLDTFVNQGD